MLHDSSLLGEYHAPGCSGRVGSDRPSLRWFEAKWLCTNDSCFRKVFTEAVSGIPPRSRITPRAKTMMVHAVLDDDRSVATMAGDHRCGLHTAHDEVVADADHGSRAGDRNYTSQPFRSAKPGRCRNHSVATHFSPCRTGAPA